MLYGGAGFVYVGVPVPFGYPRSARQGGKGEVAGCVKGVAQRLGVPGCCLRYMPGVLRGELPEGADRRQTD